jgi:ABC-type lipoprotein export system ATPase subunit
MPSTPILEVLEEVEFRYPEDPRTCYSIPAGLTLAVGEAWCIYGISGSGKSTLMTLLASLRRLERGRVRYRFSDSIVAVTPETWTATVGPSLWCRIGFAFQRPEMIRSLSVIDNLRLVLDDGALDHPSLFTEEREWKRIANSRVWEISGGQVQRLGLLRAFGRGQNLVFLDEPTNNLDRRNRDAVAQFVRDHRKTHALVVVSHDEDFVRTLGIDCHLEVSETATPKGDIRRALNVVPAGRSESSRPEAASDDPALVPLVAESPEGVHRESSHGGSAS